MRHHRLSLALLVLAPLCAGSALAQASAPSKGGDLSLDDLPLDGPVPTPKARPKAPPAKSKPSAGKTKLVPKSGKSAPSQAPAPEGSGIFVAAPPSDDVGLPMPPLPEVPLPAAPARVQAPAPRPATPARPPPSEAAKATPPARAAAAGTAVAPEAELPPPPIFIAPAPLAAQARTAAPPAPAAAEKPRAAPPAALSEGTPPGEPVRWSRIAGYGAAGTGAVLLAIAGVEGAHSSSLRSDAEASFKANGGAYAQKDLPNLQSANSAARAANLLLLLGGVAVAAGAALLLAF